MAGFRGEQLRLHERDVTSRISSTNIQ